MEEYCKILLDPVPSKGWTQEVHWRENTITAADVFLDVKPLGLERMQGQGVIRDGFTHRPNRPWPRAPRNDIFYDDSMLTENLQNCAEA